MKYYSDTKGFKDDDKYNKHIHKQLKVFDLKGKILNNKEIIITQKGMINNMRNAADGNTFFGTALQYQNVLQLFNIY